VPRFGMRKFPHALAALTAILLAIAGCLAAAVVPARAAVYMNSVEPLRGEYHQHPYGELNIVVPLDADARAAGEAMAGETH
jgi:hypothetical protein